MRKSFFRILLLFSIPIQLVAQTWSGKVIESENSLLISDVLILNSSNNDSTKTDIEGNFSLSNSGYYTFTKEGFISKTVLIKDLKFLLIKLDSRPESLSEIIITTSNFQTQLKNYDGAISYLPAKQIKSNNTINVAPILNAVSGVFMQNGTLTTNRITIRGIGSRNVFGTSKIRAYYQEIPLTNGSGESTIEDIEMNALGRIEIMKGPSSSMYGAGLGGTIHLIPNKGQLENSYIKSGILLGSFDLQKFDVQVSIGGQTNSANIIYSNTQSDGYRENNDLKRQVISAASNHYLNENNKLSFIGNYIDLKAFIPSSIDEETYLNSPESAAITWANAKGYEDYKKGLFGLSWQHKFSAKTQQYTSIFTSFLDSYEARPFNILQEKTIAFGIRSKIISETKLFDKKLDWTIGFELFNDKNSYQTYDNLYQDFPPNNGSVQGELSSDFDENRTYFNLFMDSNYILTTNLVLNFGINLNQTSYTLADNYSYDNKNFSGDYRFDAILSPKVGLTYQIFKNLMVYGTISHGFSPPTLPETLLADGLINTTIKPETGWNYELGSRGELFSNKLFYDLAFYTMDVKNLLVAQRTSDDQFIGINAGKTKYNGIEFTLNYEILQTQKTTLSFLNALTFNDFTFEKFINLDSDYSGNQLTGVPKFTFNSGVDYESKFGLYAFIFYNYVSQIPMRDDNSVFSKEYQLVNTKLGFRRSFSKKLHLDFFFGMNNVFNEKYASMLLINAGSFGTNSPRYYYPGEPTNFYSGLNLKYSL